MVQLMYLAPDAVVAWVVLVVVVQVLVTGRILLRVQPILVAVVVAVKTLTVRTAAQAW